MNEAKTIGLVVAPGVTEKLAESLIDDIPNILSHQNNNQHDWEASRGRSSDRLCRICWQNF